VPHCIDWSNRGSDLVRKREGLTNTHLVGEKSRQEIVVSEHWLSPVLQLCYCESALLVHTTVVLGVATTGGASFRAKVVACPGGQLCVRTWHGHAPSEGHLCA